jgi:hypothetical protein
VNRQLISALQGAAAAYRNAARTAGSGDAEAYRAASAAIPGAKARLNEALDAVRSAGYESTGTGEPGTETPGAGRAAAPGDSESEPAEPAPSRADVGDSRSDDPSDDSADP